MIKDTPFGYGTLSKILHWSIALLIIGNLAAGMLLEDMTPEMRGTVMPLHKSFGALILILMLARLGWRISQGFPTIPASIPDLEQRMARIVHMIFYPVLILMPFVGWMMSSAADRTTSFFGLFDLPRIIMPDPALREFFGAAHSALGWVILLLVLGHAGAAIYHHYWRRTKFIRRMT